MGNLLCSSFRHHNFIDDDSEVIHFNVEELNAYTGKFNRLKWIGHGAFGPVYRGTIKGRKEINVNGLRVAIKYSHNKYERARSQWQAEIEYLPKVIHQNVIKLIGYCETEERFYLVYPFMPNGTLSTQSQGLDWGKTLKIIKGVARGIEKLHGLMPPLIHGDLKLDNILLDKDFNPKISDFGTVKSEGEHLSSSGSKEGDIYDFGTIILQVIMKEKVGYYTGANNNVEWHIRDLANSNYSSSRTCVNVKLTSTGCSKRAANTITELGLRCCDPQPSQRPTISQVLQTLADL